MAAGTISAPGSEYGPCTDDCAHIDCAASRDTAESPCTMCGHPIGYETRFYADRPGWVHALCLEEDELSSTP